MPKKGEKRPDDLHKAQKQAVEVLLPVKESDAKAQVTKEEPAVGESVGENTQAPHTRGVDSIPGSGPPGLASAIEELVPYSGEEVSIGGNVDAKQTPTSEQKVQQIVASEGPAQEATVLAKLQAQVDQLRGEVATVRLGDKGTVTSEGPAGYPWQYYKRPVRENDPMSNWIVTAPGGPSPKGRDMASLMLYTNKGHLPITAYGPAPIPSEVHRLGPGANYINMLQNGGAKEFPISQVLTLKWHLNCPVPGIKFESTEQAIADGKVKRFVCPDCDLELWFEITDTETPLVCFRHMRAKKNPDDGRHGISRHEAQSVMAEIGVSIGGLSPQEEYQKAQELDTATVDTV